MPTERDDSKALREAFGGSNDVSTLIQWLDDPVVGGCAAAALGAIRDPRAILPLLRAAVDGRYPSALFIDIAGTIIESLRPELSGLAEALRFVLRHEDTEALALELADAIGRGGTLRRHAIRVATWVADDDCVSSVMLALCDPVAADAAVDYLGTHVEQLRARASALGRHPAAVRRGALRAIREIGCAEDLGWVGPFLRDADPDVRAEAVRTVGAIGPGHEIDHIIEMLGDDVPEVAMTSAQVLAGTDISEHVDRVAKQARAATGYRASAAATLLANVPGLWEHEVLGEIAEKLCDSGGQAAREALALSVGLASERSRRVAAALAADEAPAVRAAVAAALIVSSDAVAREVLDQLVLDASPDVRAAAVHSLAIAGGREGSLLVSAVLDDEAPEVVCAALGALGEMRMTAFAEDVEAACGDGNPEIAVAAMRSLGKLDSALASKVAREQMSGGRPRQVRVAVAELLLAEDAESAAVMFELLGDPEPEVRAAAAAHAFRVLRAEALPLLRTLSADPSTDLAAMKALAASGDAGIEELCRLVSGDTECDRVTACAVLGGSGHARAHQALTDLLSRGGEDGPWYALLGLMGSPDGWAQVA